MNWEAGTVKHGIGSLLWEPWLPVACYTGCQEALGDGAFLRDGGTHLVNLPYWVKTASSMLPG